MSSITDATPGPADRDNKHLKVLSIFHYVWGGLIALVSCVFIIHLVLGILMLANPGAFNASDPNAAPPPREVGYLFAGMGAGCLLLGWTVAGLNILAGRSIAGRRRWMLAVVMAGLNCLSFPFGTALGVCTLMVLLRDPVKAQFGRPVRTAAPSPAPAAFAAASPAAA